MASNNKKVTSSRLANTTPSRTNNIKATDKNTDSITQIENVKATLTKVIDEKFEELKKVITN